jgi:hypothetical protein
MRCALPPTYNVYATSRFPFRTLLCLISFLLPTPPPASLPTVRYTLEHTLIVYQQAGEGTRSPYLYGLKTFQEITPEQFSATPYLHQRVGRRKSMLNAVRQSSNPFALAITQWKGPTHLPVNRYIGTLCFPDTDPRIPRSRIPYLVLNFGVPPPQLQPHEFPPPPPIQPPRELTAAAKAILKRSLYMIRDDLMSVFQPAPTPALTPPDHAPPYGTPYTQPNAPFALHLRPHAHTHPHPQIQVPMHTHPQTPVQFPMHAQAPPHYVYPYQFDAMAAEVPAPLNTYSAEVTGGRAGLITQQRSTKMRRLNSNNGNSGTSAGTGNSSGYGNRFDPATRLRPYEQIASFLAPSNCPTRVTASLDQLVGIIVLDSDSGKATADA